MPPEFFLSDGLFEGLRDGRGPRAPVVALLDGTPAAPWHDRRDGAWGRMVTDEAIAAVAEEPAGRHPPGRDRRDLARRLRRAGPRGPATRPLLRRRRHSPALWPRAADAPRGLFDSPADFARHDVLGARAALRAALRDDCRVWLDRGDADPYRAATDRLSRTLRAGDTRLTVRRAPGGHDRDYWDRQVARWVAFYTRALADCAT